jgi:hypothetical protein
MTGAVSKGWFLWHVSQPLCRNDMCRTKAAIGPETKMMQLKQSTYT